MAPRDEGSFPSSLSHPAFGRSALEPSRLAVRWRPGAADGARESLLADAGLSPVESTAERPSIAVNRTEGLWWVEHSGGEPVTRDELARLEQSELVEWIAPAYRTQARSDADETLYAVNPTRLYVREEAFAAAGGPQALPDGVALDSARTTQMPGLTVVRIEDVSAAEGRTAVHVAEQLATRLSAEASVDPARAVRFENIPYFSPTCCGCRPPAGEFIPSDPMFADQWGLQRIEVPRAWEIARGNPSVTVAVIDEGVRAQPPGPRRSHPQSWNASTDTPDGSPTGNHGTACAGIVAARLDNGAGAAGVAGGIARDGDRHRDVGRRGHRRGPLLRRRPRGARRLHELRRVRVVGHLGLRPHPRTRCSTRTTRAWCWWQPAATRTSPCRASPGATPYAVRRRQQQRRRAQADRRHLGRAVVGRELRARPRCRRALPRDPDDGPARGRRLRPRRLLRHASTVRRRRRRTWPGSRR